MKKHLIPLLALLPGISMADDIVINTSAEARTWCKNKSTEYFLAKDKTPYNWSSIWWGKQNIIHVKGSWTAEKIEYVVKCKFKKGQKERYAIITIDEKKPKKSQKNSASQIKLFKNQ